MFELISRVGVGGGSPNDSRLLGLTKVSVIPSYCAGAVEMTLLLLALVRFLELRTVMFDGIWDWLSADPDRGEALGGVDTGAGSLDRADCTRCSSFCIFPIRPRICVREVELGNVDGSLFSVVLRLAGVANPVAEGSRECLDARDEK